MATIISEMHFVIASKSSGDVETLLFIIKRLEPNTVDFHLKHYFKNAMR